MTGPSGRALLLVGAGLTWLACGGPTRELGDGGASDAAWGTAGDAGGIDGGGRALFVSGNRLIDGTGAPVRLLGVNRSGTEYMCISGRGFFEGPSDDASIQAIKSWRTNAVRVPLNEGCWLNINTPPGYGGGAYQAAVADYVHRLNAAGLYVILDLHWTAPDGGIANQQHPMPDREHTPVFWTQVASAYLDAGMVLFDLFNEPYPDSNRDTDAAWTCWLDGGTCPGVPFTAAGMQELVDAVRSTGSSNVVMLGGVEYSNALTGWLAHKPTDPTGNLVASWHVYDFNGCRDSPCYDREAGPVAAQVPLITGEIGDSDCDAGFLDGVMGWLDAHQSSYLAWTWDTWGTACSTFALISDYSGTPTLYGQAYQSHLAAVGP